LGLRIATEDEEAKNQQDHKVNYTDNNDQELADYTFNVFKDGVIEQL